MNENGVKWREAKRRPGAEGSLQECTGSVAAGEVAG